MAVQRPLGVKAKLWMLLSAGLMLLAACAPADAGNGIPPHLEAEAAGVEGVKAEILADNVVTMDELEQAALRVRDCMVEAGIKVEEFEFDQGDLGVTMSIDSSSDDGAAATAEADSVHDRCYESEYRLISEIYNYQNRLTADEQEQLDQEWVNCLADHGVFVERLKDISASNPDQRVAVVRCTEQLEEQGW